MCDPCTARQSYKVDRNGRVNCTCTLPLLSFLPGMELVACFSLIPFIRHIELSLGMDVYKTPRRTTSMARAG